MEENQNNKKRLDLSRYESIKDKNTVDNILEDMRINKIYPSDSLKGVILQRIGKVSIQKYLVEKFQETKDKIEKKTSKRVDKKETK